MKKFIISKLCSLETYNFTEMNFFIGNFKDFDCKFHQESFLKGIVFCFEKLYVDWRYTNVNYSYFYWVT